MLVKGATDVNAGLTYLDLSEYNDRGHSKKKKKKKKKNTGIPTRVQYQ